MSSLDEFGDTLTAREAARVLDVNINTLHGQLRATNGRIAGVRVGFRVGRSWRLGREALRQLLAGQEREPEPEPETAEPRR